MNGKGRKVPASARAVACFKSGREREGVSDPNESLREGVDQSLCRRVRSHVQFIMKKPLQFLVMASGGLRLAHRRIQTHHGPAGFFIKRITQNSPQRTVQRLVRRPALLLKRRQLPQRGAIALRLPFPLRAGPVLKETGQQIAAIQGDGLLERDNLSVRSQSLCGGVQGRLILGQISRHRLLTQANVDPIRLQNAAGRQIGRLQLVTQGTQRNAQAQAAAGRATFRPEQFLKFLAGMRSPRRTGQAGKEAGGLAAGKARDDLRADLNFELAQQSDTAKRGNHWCLYGCRKLRRNAISPTLLSRLHRPPTIMPTQACVTPLASG